LELLWLLLLAVPIVLLLVAILWAYHRKRGKIYRTIFGGKRGPAEPPGGKVVSRGPSLGVDEGGEPAKADNIVSGAAVHSGPPGAENTIMPVAHELDVTRLSGVTRGAQLSWTEEELTKVEEKVPGSDLRSDRSSRFAI